MKNPEFQNAGFEVYQHPEPDCTQFYKTVLHPLYGKKTYFIHATQWAREGQVSVEFDAHFYLPADNKFGTSDSSFRVTFVPGVDATIEGVEAVFKQIYELLGCVPDPNDD